MKSSTFRLLVMLALLGSTGTVLAQNGIGSGSLPQILVDPPPAPMLGGIMGGVSLGAYNMNAFKGQPYSCKQTTTTVKTLADGTIITNVLEERILRDSEGRERRELSVMKDGNIDVISIRLTDPVENEMVTLFTHDKSAHVLHVPRPRMQSAPQPQPQTAEQKAKMEELRAKLAAYRKEHPAPNAEKLPGQIVAGVYAEGVHHTLVIPAGREGNDRDIHVETETWTSPDLKIVVLSKTDDPRIGKITREVSELQRIEPDPALFRIPSDYKVVEQK